jgi:hypothetical protein
VVVGDNCTGWQALLGDAAGGPDTPVSAAPARVADPAGLPPAYIEVGQLDIFRDEDLTYALRLGQAGSRSSSTSTPASRTNSTSLPSTPPPPGASWPTASAPSPPCDHAANGTSSLPRPRRHPRCLRRSSCTSSRWPPAKPPRPTTLFAGSRTGSDPDWDSPACAKEEPDEPDRAVRRNDRLPRHGPGPHERAAARLLMDASLWNDVIPTCPPITGAWHRRCPWRHTTTRCAPTPTCRCPGSPSWSPSSSTASTCATSPSSATTPAARPTPRLRRSGPARADRSRLCDAFDNFPPGLTGRTLVLTGKIPTGLFGLFMRHMRLRPVRRLPIAFGWLTKRGDAATRRWIRPVLHQRAIRRDTVRALRAAAAENVMLEAAGSLGAYHRPALVVGRTRTASCRPTTAAASPSSSSKAGWSRYRTPTRSSPGPARTALADRA